MASENTIYFYPGQGGHSHNGENSSFIDTSKYSLFDFSWGFLGDPSRVSSQTMNYNSFQNFIVETINNAVLKPAGLILQPGTVNGDSDIISNSISTKLIAANAITANEIAANTITANQIAANTITANQIAAGAITADELTANIVLINNIIRSNNFDGTILSNGAITTAGTAGWAVSGQGQAVFDTTFIRGAIVAASVSTPGIDILSNGAISSANFNVTADGDLTATNANITGQINATSGSISGNLVTGGTISGTAININNAFKVDASGNLIATSANITGQINATSGSISGNLVTGGTITGTALTVGGRISLPTDGGIIALGTASSGSATQCYIFAGGSQGFQIDTSSRGSSWFAGATWYVNNSEFQNARELTGLVTSVGSGTALVVNAGYVYRSSSKRELKDNIQDFNNISLIDGLRPVSFTWKENINSKKQETEEEIARRESSVNIGFIAEEVEEASDGLLSVYNYEEGGNGEVEMYKHLDILSLCVANIKDLRTRVAILEARIAELEG